MNPAFERTTGYTSEEVMGKNPRILKSGRQDDAFYEELWETISNGKVFKGRMNNLKKNGSVFVEDVTISPVTDANGEIQRYVAVKRDVTNEIALEEEVRQASKMQAVGQLAGGVAHDFNNIIQAVMGYCRLLKRRIPEETEAVTYVNEIEKSADRAADLTRQLLAFGRSQVLRRANLDLNACIGDLIGMLKRLIRENVELVFEPDPALTRSIYADRNQIEQVLINLCVNARDAMPDGGRLRIRTRDKTGTPPEKLPDGDAATFVQLVVSDTGVGIPLEIQERIFDPFFTTKAEGEGTGLGLSTVYGIIRQHGGHLHVESAPGQGTEFRIWFPQSTVADTRSPFESESPFTDGSETILMAEDNPQIRRLLPVMLEDNGYTVIVCANGKEALDAFEEQDGEIDLVILDVIMPFFGGRQVMERIREKNGNVRFLFCSGYSRSDPDFDFLEKSDIELLPKPYSEDDLLKAIRRALDA